jgi:hypothetical protein
MSHIRLASGLLAAWLLLLVPARGADEKAIEQAIEKGKAHLKARHARGVPTDPHHAFGIGPAALSGVALIEARVPADDPSIKAIAAAVREAAYTEVKTYQVALCLMFLDKLEDPADVPMIQVLALRLLAGQQSNGGWGYNACGAVSGEQAQWLRANLRPKPPADPKQPADPKAKPTPRLTPEVSTYASSISRPPPGDPNDNSNTQFAILGLWLSRKHGVPVEAALDAIEKRFRATQDAQGGWGYFGPTGATFSTPGVASASMTCCGLLGVATGNARRAEKRPPKESVLKSVPKGDDPFFTNPSKAEGKTPEKAPETRDPAALRGLAVLGQFLGAYVQAGAILQPGDKHGDRDLYLLWSIERVGVIYNLDKIGGINWYDVGSEAILKAQGGDGSWGNGHHYGGDANTSFALLFLCKADLLRDLSNKFRNPKDTELRAGTSGAVPAGNGNSGTETAPMPKGSNIPGTTPLPNVVDDASTKLATALIQAPATDWGKALEKLRDAKGAENTRGLVLAIHRLEGDRKKEAREALAERLTRMSAETLKGMMGQDDAELRRGAVLAAAMRDDKAHVPDLIERLQDESEVVVRAARAGLKSLTSQDFGPKPGASAEDHKAAVAAWKAWWARQKP